MSVLMVNDFADFINKHSINNLADIMQYNPELGFVYANHYRVDEFGYKETLVRLDMQEKIKNHGAGILFNKAIFLKYDMSMDQRTLNQLVIIDFLMKSF